MGKLIYSAITSLDGFVSDDDGSFDWAAPDGQVHAFINDLERPIGTYLYGRRMYETMSFWEDPPDFGTQPPAMADDAEMWRAAMEYADIWQAAEKVVYSRTLSAVNTARTRLERSFDAVDVARLKDTLDADLTIGGPDLASHALVAGLVDELHLFVSPVVVGSGKHYLPGVGRLDLQLRSTRAFDNGMVHQHYAIR